MFTPSCEVSKEAVLWARNKIRAPGGRAQELALTDLAAFQACIDKCFDLYPMTDVMHHTVISQKTAIRNHISIALNLCIQ